MLPKIISATGSTISADEIGAVQRVISTRVGIQNVGIYQMTDQATGVLVEYHPFKNTAYVTPGNATDYVAMVMPNPVPYRGIFVGDISKGSPTLSGDYTSWTAYHADGTVYTSGAGSWHPVVISSGGGGFYEEGPAVNYLWLSGPPSPKWQLFSGTLGYSSAQFGGFYPNGTFTNLGYEALYTADVSAGIAGTKRHVMASDGAILASKQLPYLYELFQDGNNNYWVIPSIGYDEWSGNSHITLIGQPATTTAGNSQLNFTLPEDCIYPEPLPAFDFTSLDPYRFRIYPYPAASQIQFPTQNLYSLGGIVTVNGVTSYTEVHSAYDVNGQIYIVGTTILSGLSRAEAIAKIRQDNINAYVAVNPSIAQSIIAWYAELASGEIAFFAHRQSWLKKNSDELISALKAGFSATAVGVTHVVLKNGLPDNWGNGVRQNIQTRYGEFPRDAFGIMVGHHTAIEPTYNETSWSDTVISDTSSGRTQNGVLITQRVCTLEYTLGTEIRTATITGTLTEIVTRHINAAGSYVGVSIRSEYSNFYDLGGKVINGIEQNGYNADSSNGQVSDPFLHAYYSPPYPQRSKSTISTVPDFLRIWKQSASIKYYRDGVGANTYLNDSASHGVTEIHISPIGLIADGLAHAPAGTSLGIFSTAEDGTQVEIYGTAIYGFDWLTGALTFKSWKPLYDINGNEVQSKVIDLPAGKKYSDYPNNCIITYKGLHWPDVVAAINLRDKDAKSGTFAHSDHVWYALVNALKLG